MPPRRNAKTGAANGPKQPSSKSRPFVDVPPPFRQAPDSLQPFLDGLVPKHVYVTHIDNRPWTFKRKIFAVPVLMNIAVALLFVWRMSYVAPYYYLLLETAFGTTNETTLVARDLSWYELFDTVGRRGLSFMFDLCLAIFVWPWPMEFCVGGGDASPVQWRWMVGFRDQEIYVRRSREWFADALKQSLSDGQEGGDADKAPETAAGGVVRDKSARKADILKDPKATRIVLGYVAQATEPLLLQQKTGYLTMNGDWDLDWGMMIWSTKLVDRKDIALEAFTSMALVHHGLYGWLTVDLRAIHGDAAGPAQPGPEEERRRQQVFAFREALVALDKEDLFFRWIEIIQFEASKPGGLGNSEQQAAVAQQVRTLFQENGVDFDAVWRDAVGSDGLAGM